MSPCPHELLTYWALEAVKVYGRFIGPRYLVFLPPAAETVGTFVLIMPNSDRCVR